MLFLSVITATFHSSFSIIFNLALVRFKFAKFEILYYGGTDHLTAQCKAYNNNQRSGILEAKKQREVTYNTNRLFTH
jgi:hypothetical protein